MDKKIPKLEIKENKLFYLGREITSVSLSSFQETQYYYLSVYSGPSLVGRIMFSELETPIKYLKFIREK